MARDPIQDLITKSAAQHGIRSDLLYALLEAESGPGFDPNARSPKGALGIAQFMPETAAEMGINPLNPHEAVPAAAKYLSSLIKQFGSEEMGLAAYNWGMGNLRRLGMEKAPKETRDYVAKVMEGAGPPGAPPDAIPVVAGSSGGSSTAPAPKPAPQRDQRLSSLLNFVAPIQGSLVPASNQLRQAWETAVDPRRQPPQGQFLAGLLQHLLAAPEPGADPITQSPIARMLPQPPKSSETRDKLGFLLDVVDPTNALHAMPIIPFPFRTARAARELDDLVSPEALSRQQAIWEQQGRQFLGDEASKLSEMNLRDMGREFGLLERSMAKGRSIKTTLERVEHRAQMHGLKLDLSRFKRYMMEFESRK